MQLTTIIPLIAGILSATLARPSPAPVSSPRSPVSHQGPDPVGANTQSCSTYSQGLSIWYSVQIGEPYDEASGCDNVYHALVDATHYVASWDCSDDGWGNTLLSFTDFQNEGGAINAALEAMYPNVAGGFNCANQ